MARALTVWNQKSRESSDELSREERLALHRLRMEAKNRGAKLASAGRGGLSPSLALHVFRRDEYVCKVCGGNGHESGGLQLHHKGGLENPTSRWLEVQGKRNEPNNLVTICKSCHDNVHDEDRAMGDEDTEEAVDA